MVKRTRHTVYAENSPASKVGKTDEVDSASASKFATPKASKVTKATKATKPATPATKPATPATKPATPATKPTTPVAEPSDAPLFFLSRAGDDALDAHERSEETRDFEENDTAPHMSNTTDNAHHNDGAVKSDSDDEDDKDNDNHERKPAWVDDDDESLVVDIRGNKPVLQSKKGANQNALSGAQYVEHLREKYLEVNPQASWANLDPNVATGNEESDEEDEKKEEDVFKMEDSQLEASDSKEPSQSEPEHKLSDLLQKNSRLTQWKKKSLQERTIAAIRIPDGNLSQPFESVIVSTLFHPSLSLLFTLSQDRYLRIFQIDGKKNPMVHSMYFKRDVPRKGVFSPDGKELYITCNKSYFYTYQIVDGRFETFTLKMSRPGPLNEFVVSPDGTKLAFSSDDGHILFVCTKSKHLLKDVKMNGPVFGMCFSHDSKYFYTGGKGDIYKWDMSTYRCVCLINDQGSTQCNLLACSSDGRYFATGSSVGVVNIYSTSDIGVTPRCSPKPIKAVEVLVTSITSMVFNHDTQLLAIVSKDSPKAIRLIHLPSCSVYTNFPVHSSDLGTVTTVAFSPQSGYLLFATAAGKIPMYRLKYYGRV